MAKELLDAQGNPVAQEKTILTNLNEKLGIEISQKSAALMDVMMTAEMLHAYATHAISEELSEHMEDVREEVTRQLSEVTEFDLTSVKYRLFDALQVVMTHFAEAYLVQKMSDDAKAFAAEQKDADTGKPDEPKED